MIPIKYLLPLISMSLLTFAVIHVVKANQIPPKPLPPITPSESPYSFTIAGSGVVEPQSENIAIGSNLSGIVKTVYVAVGQKVQRGEKLFDLDDRQLLAELKVREANAEVMRSALEKQLGFPRLEELPSAEAKVREAMANLRDAQDQQQRSRRLIKNMAVGEEEVIHRNQLVAVAEAQLEKAKADLALLRAGAWKFDKELARVNYLQAVTAAQQTKIELQRNIVTAPIDGTILQKNIRVGEYVNAIAGQPLLIMGNIDQLNIRLDIDENDLPQFTPGLSGVGYLRGEPSKPIPLRFVRIEPYLIPKKSLTGAGTERVDTRVLQVIYAVDPSVDSSVNSSAESSMNLFVGQQIDVYLNKIGKASSTFKNEP